jgi:translation initiation factor IF-3
MGKYSKKNLRGNWQEEDLQNAMRAVRTSKLSTNFDAIDYRVQTRILRAYLAENKQSKSILGRKTVFSHNRRKSYPREYLG